MQGDRIMMSDKLDKFTKRARRSVTYAQEEATRLDHNYIGTGHFLLGLIRVEDGNAALVLRNLGMDLERTRQAVESISKHGEAAAGARLSLTPRAKRVIENAVDEARQMGHHYIGTEHMLLGITHEYDGVAGQVLDRMGISPETIRTQLSRALIQSFLPGKQTNTTPILNPQPTVNVFIVHGHDEAAKESVARTIEKLGLGAMILHEQPNAGKTIIEKFEEYSKVGFAVVLLTPDDMVATSEKPKRSKPRPRQNVIFEFGYFVGKLGRGKVCALYKEGVEIPSDYNGVLYIPMDSSGAWRILLAKEIKNAGIDVDLNKL
jgi:predicted nucleotide-binding protein